MMLQHSIISILQKLVPFCSLYLTLSLSSQGLRSSRCMDPRSGSDMALLYNFVLDFRGNCEEMRKVWENLLKGNVKLQSKAGCFDRGLEKFRDSRAKIPI